MEDVITNQTPFRLPPVPAPEVLEALHERLSGQELQALESIFALRGAAQQVDNTVTEWLAGTAGSPARFQILTLLWANKGHRVPHQMIVATMGVKKATVSGLMAALENDGLVRSSVDSTDRRRLLATLTARGESIINKAIETNSLRLYGALASLSPGELTALTEMLRRVREGFAAGMTTRAEKPRRRQRSAVQSRQRRA